jgi:peroxiredoxin
MDEASDPPRRRRRPDPVTAMMMVVTATALVGAIWLKVKGTTANDPPRVGAMAPPVRLLDFETSEPLVLVGQRGKVVWLYFWSAESTSGRAGLTAVERASVVLRARSRFALVAAAVDSDQPARVRAAVAESRLNLPVYLASIETLQRYGVVAGSLPLHILIDADGRIAAIARETGPQTIERIAGQARRLLDELGPPDDTRFASAASRRFG